MILGEYVEGRFWGGLRLRACSAGNGWRLFNVILEWDRKGNV